MVLLSTIFMAPIQIKKLLLHKTNIRLRILILLLFECQVIHFPFVWFQGSKFIY